MIWPTKNVVEEPIEWPDRQQKNKDVIWAKRPQTDLPNLPNDDEELKDLGESI